MQRRTFLNTTLAAALGLGSLATGTMVLAEPGAWTSDPVRIVVTFPPGGTSDLVARLLAKHLDENFGQKAVVDNRPGAAGTVAADFVAQQDPDGTTLILANNAPFTIAPTQFDTIPYDPLGSFSHIAYIGASAPGLLVQPSMGIKDLAGFVELSKSGPITYGSSGVGSISHILGAAVEGALGIKTVHVPYKGSAPAIQDFRAGVLGTFYDLLAQNKPMIDDGEAVAIAVAAPERLAQLPDVPTFREQGYDVVLENWVGVSGPAGIDPAMVAKINETVLAVVALPEVQARLTEWGITSVAQSSADYTAFVSNQIGIWKPLIIAAGAEGK